MPLLFRLTHYAAIKDNKSIRNPVRSVKTVIYTAVKTSPTDIFFNAREHMENANFSVHAKP